MSQNLQSRPKRPSQPQSPSHTQHPSRTKGSPRLDRAVKARTDPDDARFDGHPGETLGRDILKNRYVSALMRSRWYHGAFQIPVAAVFGPVAYELLAGPPAAHDNAGTALMWVLWWPLLPLLYVLFGRLSRTGGLALSVADTGDGIPAEHLPHVFERFYRVDTAGDRTHGGSGIGLAIAKALVQAHGGQLTLTSPGTGQGSTFLILLPRQ